MIQVDPETLRRVRESLDAHLHLRAWETARPLGALARWGGAAAGVVAGRLAKALGASRLGLAVHLRAGRRHPGDAVAMVAFGRAVLAARGPLAALNLVRSACLPAAASEPARADWLALEAAVATGFRDFDTAQARLEAAESVCPGRPSVCAERLQWLEQQDKVGAALELAQATLTRAPLDLAAIGATAHLLERTGRAEEALALVTEKDAALECATLAAHRALLLLEQERADEAEAALARFEVLSPLLEETGRQWLAARRCDAACRRGDLTAARALAEQAGGGFYREVARRLGEARDRRRVLLPVPYVRQDHLGCSPASLAAVAGYWSHRLDPRELAREIAWDGTAGHREREWARARGWTAREFRLTEAAAIALLEAGAPFLLGRQRTGDAHAQVVAGFDGRRGTLLVRDPAWPRLTEVLLDRLLEDQAAFGPRCLVLLPPEAAGRIASLSLPEEAGYDAYHELQLRLLAGDRAGAAAVRAAFPSDPAHERLRLLMDVRLAAYDDDAAAGLRACEALLARFPGATALRMRRVELLIALDRGTEADALLEEWTRPRSADPSCVLRLAERSPGSPQEAERGFRRVLRARPTEAAALAGLARCLRERSEVEEALVLDRLAACCDPQGEERAGGYVREALALNRNEEAVAFLRSRARRLLHLSGRPTHDLVQTLVQLGRDEEAVAELEALAAQHPTDVWAHRERALLLSRLGRHDAALAALQPALALAPEEAGTLGIQGRLLLAAGRRNEATQCFRAAIERSIGYLPGIDGLLEAADDADGRRAALRFVAERVDRAATGTEPHDADAVLAAAWRLAERTAQHGTPADALEAAERLASLAPAHPEALRLRAAARRGLGDEAGARADLDAARALEALG